MRPLPSPLLRPYITGAVSVALSLGLVACSSSKDSPPQSDPSAVVTDIAPPSATAAETFGGQGLSSFTLEKISKSLTKAIATGDEKTFLGYMAPGHPRLVAQQRTWFRNVRAVPMKRRNIVLVRPTRSIDSSGKGVLTALVGFNHQVTGADPRPVSEWYAFGFKRSGATLKVVSVSGGPPDSSRGTKYSRYYRQAWDDGSMAVLSDEKVTLLGPQDDRGTLQALLPRVSSAVREQIAAFRRSGVKVDSDVYSRKWVFTYPAADVADFFDYFGGTLKPREANFDAVTNPIYSSYSFGDLAYDKGVTTSRITLNRSMAARSSEAFATTIRHEMVHAVQESWDISGFSQSPTWVTEGLAVAFSRPGSSEASYRASAGRRGLAGATSFPADETFYKGDDEAVSQHYGMGYLAMSYLLEKRGARAVLSLVRGMERTGIEDDFYPRLGISQKVLLARVKAWA